jgi:hypothetical protein
MWPSKAQIGIYAAAAAVAETASVVQYTADALSAP